MDGIKTFVGNLELVKSDMAHVTADYKLSISFNGVMFIEFEFIDDENNKDFSINKEIINDNKTLVLKCANFNNSLGQGIVQPLEVGTFNSKRLYISFFVWTPDQSQNQRLVSYSIYLAKQ